MAKIVDARGLTCPQPVVMTGKALEEADEVIAIVDNEVAKENVSRLAYSKGFQVSVDEKEGVMYLYLTKLPAQPCEILGQTVTGPLILLVPSDCFGRGDDELGHLLIRSFIYTLGEVSPNPNKIVFINSGVKLVTEGSEVLDDLRSLEKHGIELLACGTCLGYYNLKKMVKVGRISNMYEIASTLLQAGKIVAL